MTDWPATIEFEVRTPVPNPMIRANIAWSRRMGYPEVPASAERPGVVNIVANGPSALDAPLDGLTLSLNGSLAVFNRKGLAPTWWAGCDPQVHMADFLQYPPKPTTYLVASKCDRAVFRALKGHDVRLWHIDDMPGLPGAVPTATSITLVAMSLLRRMGYRQFRLWGWDGCYLDGRDHAMPQPHQGENITVYVGDTPYRTTTTWAAEAQDAVNQLSGADYQVDIRGPGMVGAIVRALCPDDVLLHSPVHQTGAAGI